MSCIVLIGGIIGCGKTTLIDFIYDHKNELFNEHDLIKIDGSNPVISYPKKDAIAKSKNICKLILDDLCSIQEQSELMKTLKGWRNFRVDLLMASEYYISDTCKLECKVAGPLSERSHNLLHKLEKINETNNKVSDAIFFVEDNFYYRSMRYDWFQIARRANIGFCEVFLECPLSFAIQRNSTRGYQIPEQKIQMMLSCIEYPNPSKYKWETHSIVFDSTSKLQCSSLRSIFSVIIKATNNPAEILVTEEKVEAQRICSKNAVHQADNILRKMISRKISGFKENVTDTETLNSLISSAIDVRQEVLNGLRQGSIHISKDLLENLQNLGIKSVQHQYEEVLNNLFEKLWLEKTSDINLRLAALVINIGSNS